MYLHIKPSLLDQTLSLGYFEVKTKTVVQISLIAISVIAGLTFVSALYGSLPSWAKWVGVSLLPIALTSCAGLSCKRPKKIDFSNAQNKQLPKEMLLQIFKHLNAEDLASSSLCCKWWYMAAGDPKLWESLYSKDHTYIPEFNGFSDLKKACFEPWFGKNAEKLSISYKQFGSKRKIYGWIEWIYTGKYLISMDSENRVTKWHVSKIKRETNWVVHTNKSYEISSIGAYKNKLILLFQAQKFDSSFALEPFRQISIIDLTDRQIKSFEIKAQKVFVSQNKVFCVSKDSTIKVLNIEKETWSFSIQYNIAKCFRGHWQVQEGKLITVNHDGFREIWDPEKGKEIGQFSRFLVEDQEMEGASAGYCVYGVKEVIVQKTKTKVHLSVNDLITKQSYERILDLRFKIQDNKIWKNHLIFTGYEGRDFCVRGIDLDSGDTVINFHGVSLRSDIFTSEGCFMSSYVHEGKIFLGTDEGKLFVYDLLTGKLQGKKRLVNSSIFPGISSRIIKIRAYRNIVLAYISNGTVMKCTLEPVKK